jgi:hypothetical protein
LELTLRARGDSVRQFAHALVLLNTGLMIVVALHFKRLLDHRRVAWLGLFATALAVLGTLALAADKAALCLTMRALGGLSEAEFKAMMPRLLAMFSKHGWMVLLRGILLLPIGFGVQVIGLPQNKSIQRWHSVLFFIGVLWIGTPDGVEVVNLIAAVLLAIAWVRDGVQMMRDDWRQVTSKSAGGEGPPPSHSCRHVCALAPDAWRRGIQAGAWPCLASRASGSSSDSGSGRQARWCRPRPIWRRALRTAKSPAGNSKPKSATVTRNGTRFAEPQVAASH